MSRFTVIVLTALLLLACGNKLGDADLNASNNLSGTIDAGGGDAQKSTPAEVLSAWNNVKNEKFRAVIIRLIIFYRALDQDFFSYTFKLSKHPQNYQTMKEMLFHPTHPLLSIWDQKVGKVELEAQQSAPCVLQNEDKDGSAVGDVSYGKICISLKNLQRLPKLDLEKQMIGLLIHEFAHLYKVEHPVNQELQDVIIENYQNLDPSEALMRELHALLAHIEFGASFKYLLPTPKYDPNVCNKTDWSAYANFYTRLNGFNFQLLREEIAEVMDFFENANSVICDPARMDSVYQDTLRRSDQVAVLVAKIEDILNAYLELNPDKIEGYKFGHWNALIVSKGVSTNNGLSLEGKAISFTTKIVDKANLLATSTVRVVLNESAALKVLMMGYLTVELSLTNPKNEFEKPYSCVGYAADDQGREQLLHLYQDMWRASEIVCTKKYAGKNSDGTIRTLPFQDQISIH